MGGVQVGPLALGGQGQTWGVATAIVSTLTLHSSIPSVKPFVQQAYPIQPAVTAPIPGESPRDSPLGDLPAQLSAGRIAVPAVPLAFPP